jgi:serine/threonine protein kinase
MSSSGSVVASANQVARLVRNVRNAAPGEYAPVGPQLAAALDAVLATHESLTAAGVPPPTADVAVDALTQPLYAAADANQLHGEDYATADFIIDFAGRRLVGRKLQTLAERARAQAQQGAATPGAAAAAAAAATVGFNAATNPIPAITPKPGGREELDRAYTVDWTTLLGQGSYARVYKARRDGVAYAVKCIDMAAAAALGDDYSKLLRELSVHAWVSKTPWSDRVAKYFDSYVGGNTLYVVLEFINGGELAAAIKTHRVGEVRARKLLAEILRTLCFMRDHGIVHRDLKSNNILLRKVVDPATGFESEMPVLIDWGYGRHISPNLVMTVQGTVEYVAPEIVERINTNTARTATFDDRADVWSTGCIAYEMAMGTPPFGLRGQPGGSAAVFKAAAAGKYQDPPAVRVSTAFSTMLRTTMLVPDWQQRLRAAEVLRDPWFGFPAAADPRMPFSRLNKLSEDTVRSSADLAEFKRQLVKYANASEVVVYSCEHSGVNETFRTTAQNVFRCNVQQANPRPFWWSPDTSKPVAQVMLDAAENGIDSQGYALSFFASPDRGACCARVAATKYMALACEVMLGPQAERSTGGKYAASNLQKTALAIVNGDADDRQVVALSELIVRPLALFSFTRA